MLPAILKERESETTVVVVPFAALVRDVVQRARELGVDCIHWQSVSRVKQDGPEWRAYLVVVSANLIEAKEFMQYLEYI